MATVSFEIEPQDRAVIDQIVDRADRFALSRDCGVSDGEGVDRLSLTMDLVACHANGMPLRLADLLATDDFNFVHDVWGIQRHIDRNTGRFETFLPRFHALEAEAA